MGYISFKPILEIASILTLSVFPILAMESGNGTTMFNKSPRLVNAITTSSDFIIELGNDVGEPLEKLTLQQVKTTQIINYYLEETFACEEELINQGKSLTIARIKKNLDNENITFIFDYPIAPGTTFTVGLKPQQNPELAGVYLFSLIAYPKKENPLGLYLGLGRLRLYQLGNHFPSIRR
jgi:Protein of unknown function (DUF2808)